MIRQGRHGRRHTLSSRMLLPRASQRKPLRRTFANSHPPAPSLPTSLSRTLPDSRLVHASLATPASCSRLAPPPYKQSTTSNRATMPPTKRKGKGKSKAEPPLLPSDDFERLPSLETWQRRQLETTPHNRRGEILSDDASNCVPSVPPPSSDDSIDSKTARKELKKDLRSLRPNRPVAPQRAARYTTTLRSVSVIPETSPAASSSEVCCRLSVWLLLLIPVAVRVY